MALPRQDMIGYAVSELMQRMQIYGTYVLGVYGLGVGGSLCSCSSPQRMHGHILDMQC
jgi:hypothetical protein